MTAVLSLISFLFNESRWTLKPWRGDSRQGKADIWLSLAGKLQTAAAELNLTAVSQSWVGTHQDRSEGHGMLLENNKKKQT